MDKISPAEDLLGGAHAFGAGPELGALIGFISLSEISGSTALESLGGLGLGLAYKTQHAASIQGFDPMEGMREIFQRLRAERPRCKCALKNPVP